MYFTEWSPRYFKCPPGPRQSCLRHYWLWSLCCNIRLCGHSVTTTSLSLQLCCRVRSGAMHRVGTPECLLTSYTLAPHLPHPDCGPAVICSHSELSEVSIKCSRKLRLSWCWVSLYGVVILILLPWWFRTSLFLLASWNYRGLFAETLLFLGITIIPFSCWKKLFFFHPHPPQIVFLSFPKHHLFYFCCQIIVFRTTTTSKNLVGRFYKLATGLKSLTLEFCLVELLKSSE